MHLLLVVTSSDTAHAHQQRANRFFNHSRESSDGDTVRVVHWLQSIAGLRADVIIVAEPPKKDIPPMEAIRWYDQLKTRLSPQGVFMDLA